MTWETVPFNRAFVDVTRQSPKVKQREFASAGRFPVVDQGVDDVAGFWDDPADVTRVARPLVLFGDHTRRVKYATSDFVMGADGVKALAPCPQLEPRFAFWWLSALSIPSAGYSRHFKFLQDRHVPIPQLAEQRRIAAILDEADALRLTAICRLRLFQKLEESAFELVLAASTDSVPLGSVVRLITGPFGSSVHKEDYVTGGIPLVNPSHILAGEVAVDPRVAVSKGKADQLSAFFLREGDVVLGRRGEMGRAAVVRKADLPALCGTGTMILRSPDHSPIGSFLARVLRTPRFVSVLAAAASGVTMPNLSQSAVADIRIPRPSAAVESRVAAFDRDMASARQQVVVATQQLDSLFASLQHRAFRGEL